jgi:hypothetical protein
VAALSMDEEEGEGDVDVDVGDVDDVAAETEGEE